MPELTENQQEYVGGLRELADFLEEHPQFIGEYAPGVRFDVFVKGDAPLMEMKALIKGTGGRWDKVDFGAWFVLRRHFGPHNLDINAEREAVCERVQVDTKTVMKPDPSAPLVPVEEPVYEWHCPDSLLAAS